MPKKRSPQKTKTQKKQPTKQTYIPFFKRLLSTTAYISEPCCMPSSLVKLNPHTNIKGTYTKI